MWNSDKDSSDSSSSAFIKSKCTFKKKLQIQENVTKTVKDIWPDGMLIRMLYYNKYIKETNVNDQNTWHTTYIDGLEILEYPEWVFLF